MRWGGAAHPPGSRDRDARQHLEVLGRRDPLVRVGVIASPSAVGRARTRAAAAPARAGRRPAARSGRARQREVGLTIRAYRPVFLLTVPARRITRERSAHWRSPTDGLPSGLDPEVMDQPQVSRVRSVRPARRCVRRRWIAGSGLRELPVGVHAAAAGRSRSAGGRAVRPAAPTVRCSSPGLSTSTHSHRVWLTACLPPVASGRTAPPRRTPPRAARRRTVGECRRPRRSARHARAVARAIPVGRAGAAGEIVAGCFRRLSWTLPSGGRVPGGRSQPARPLSECSSPSCSARCRAAGSSPRERPPVVQAHPARQRDRRRRLRR